MRYLILTTIFRVIWQLLFILAISFSSIVFAQDCELNDSRYVQGTVINGYICGNGEWILQNQSPKKIKKKKDSDTDRKEVDTDHENVATDQEAVDKDPREQLDSATNGIYF